jgi:hypothetical protein
VRVQLPGARDVGAGGGRGGAGGAGAPARGGARRGRGAAAARPAARRGRARRPRGAPLMHLTLSALAHLFIYLLVYQ